jgi:hypothetical protein
MSGKNAAEDDPLCRHAGQGFEEFPGTPASGADRLICTSVPGMSRCETSAVLVEIAKARMDLAVGEEDPLRALPWLTKRVDGSGVRQPLPCRLDALSARPGEETDLV